MYLNDVSQSSLKNYATFNFCLHSINLKLIPISDITNQTKCYLLLPFLEFVFKTEFTALLKQYTIHIFLFHNHFCF